MLELQYCHRGQTVALYIQCCCQTERKGSLVQFCQILKCVDNFKLQMHALHLLYVRFVHVLLNSPPPLFRHTLWTATLWISVYL